MIDEYCGICDELFSVLLDTFQMKDWHMTWKQFIEQAQKEIDLHCKKWKTEKVNED